ncbi:unnamed protein product [Ectocarpus sp. 6 AP-2014]
MGRNKELNKLRKRNNLDRNGSSSNGRSSVMAATSDTAGGSARGEEKRGKFRKLLTFIAAYPFVAITLAAVLPRAVLPSMKWMRLRSGLMRPVVEVHEEKQVLIVGSLGSGTSDISAALTRLGLEVGHETSDSKNERCRDGTISWAHGIRFLSGIPNLSLLCAAPRRQAFSSTMFQPSSECSYLFRSWDQCWEDECREVTKREYGCALRQRTKDAEAKAENELEARERGKQSTGTLGRSSSRGKRRRKERDQWDMEAMIESGDWPDGESAWQEGGEEAQECGTTFRRHLLQVRHPLQTIAWLVYKSAGKNKEGVGTDCGAGRQHLITASSLLTNKLIRTQLGAGGNGAFSDFDWARVASSCVQTWAWYWVVYNRAMLQGVDKWYRVEDTPASQIAAMAGFSSVTIAEALQESESAPDDEVGVGQVMTSNPTGFEVTWEEIASFPGGLLQEVSDLAVELGYEAAPGLAREAEKTSASDGGSGEGGVRDGGAKRGWRGLFGKR